MATLSDNLLLQRLNAGDTASFEQLFHRHYDRVYGLLFRLVGTRAEAEDLAQEVFLKLYNHPLAGNADDNVSAWLYRVATNLGYNAIRGRNRRRRRELLTLTSDQMPANPIEEVVARETAVAVRSALATMPERQVQLLLLRQMGFSYAELADACGVAPGSVGTLLRRAGEAFRQTYAAITPEEKHHA